MVKVRSAPSAATMVPLGEDALEAVSGGANIRIVFDDLNLPVHGTGESDRIQTASGNDTVDGHGGNDTILSGAGKN